MCLLKSHVRFEYYNQFRNLWRALGLGPTQQHWLLGKMRWLAVCRVTLDKCRVSQFSCCFSYCRSTIQSVCIYMSTLDYLVKVSIYVSRRWTKKGWRTLVMLIFAYRWCSPSWYTQWYLLHSCAPPFFPSILSSLFWVSYRVREYMREQDRPMVSLSSLTCE
jgi:hypothetical protein